MPTLPLQCSNCNLTFTIKEHDEASTFFIHQYGQIDKVQGKLFEIPCPLCIGVMEKTEG